MIGAAGSVLCLVLFCGQLAEGQENACPARLLTEALTLARVLPDGTGYGNWAKPLAVLRIAATMRLAGMNREAAAALGECSAMTGRLSDEATRDEMMVELCGEFGALNQTARARELIGKITFRNYKTVAGYVTARTALESGRAAEAEQLVEEATGDALPGKSVGDDVWMRARVKLAVRMDRPELARRLADRIKQEPWRSAALSDLAEWLAQRGQAEQALGVAGEIRDWPMAVLAFARLARIDATDRAMARLRAAAALVPGDAVRDFSLRLAVEKLAAGGKLEAARSLMGQIRSPSARLSARCSLLTRAEFDTALAELDPCPAADRALAAEALAVACAAKGMAAEALKAARRIGMPWARVRTLCAGANRLAQQKVTAGAGQLVRAAAEAAEQIADPGWRACAEVRLALAEHGLGHSAAVAGHLDAAEREAGRLAKPEPFGTVFEQVVEAAVWTGQRATAEKAVLAALQGQPDAVLRSRLVPILVSAGCYKAALAECAKKRLGDENARRLVAYRLARARQFDAALEYARKLSPGERAQALADIALAQIPLRPAKNGPKVVGVSLHGSWGSWFPRLERMGLDWELMPFSAPYLEGPAGLRAKYSMLAYPGTGGHETHVAGAGMENMREYLRAGGGLFGICAGQYLATGQHYVPCDLVYLRGEGPHQVQIRGNHPIAVGLPPVVVIQRVNGGILMPRPGCDVIGWYDTSERYAALVAADFGQGHVVAFSPHPEGSSGLDPCDQLSIQATRWAMGELP